MPKTELSKVPEGVETLGIITYPHPALREAAEPIADPADPQVARLAQRMTQLMHEAGGVGLAATQVAVPVRLFVANPSREAGQEWVLINPEIVGTEGWQETKEGCLSIPDVTVKLRRRDRVSVRYQDIHGQFRQVDASGYLACIFQHESDHLDGRLIIDRAGLVGRLAIRDTLKRLEDEFEDARATASRKP
jgi:peptide deformylase